MAYPPIPEAERSQWIAIFEAAVERPGDEMNDDWERILDQLGLPSDYFLAVIEALRQGRWRNAKNPVSYVRRVARIEARKMGLLTSSSDILKLVDAPQNGEDFSVEETLDHLAQAGESAVPIKGEDGVWRPGWGSNKEWDYPDEDDVSDQASDRVSFADLQRQGLTEVRQPSEDLRAVIERINCSTDELHIHLTPTVHANWEKLADLAEFSEWDKLALRCRLQGVSRDRALAGQPDEESRKSLQAAWRKFDRRGAERLREAVRKIRSRNVPES